MSPTVRAAPVVAADVRAARAARAKTGAAAIADAAIAERAAALADNPIFTDASGKPLFDPFVVVDRRNYVLAGLLDWYVDASLAWAIGAPLPDRSLPKYQSTARVPATRAGERLGVGRRTLGRLELDGRRARATMAAAAE
jgi:hypothetical protein